jgi:hypothetical protein
MLLSLLRVPSNQCTGAGRLCRAALQGHHEAREAPSRQTSPSRPEPNQHFVRRLPAHQAQVRYSSIYNMRRFAQPLNGTAPDPREIAAQVLILKVDKILAKKTPSANIVRT